MNNPLTNKVFGVAPSVVAALGMALGVALGTASCVAESFDDCPDVRLLVKTDQDTNRWQGSTRAADESQWYNSIGLTSVFVFDENERFVTLWEGGIYTPGQEYEVPLEEIALPEGMYTFVAWTNLGARFGGQGRSHYTTNFEELLAALEAGESEKPEEPEESEESGTRHEVEEPEPEPEPGIYLDDLLMTMVTPDDYMTGDIPHCHYGIRTAYVSRNSILNPRENTIEIRPLIRRVNFTVTGLTTEAIGYDYTMTVTDSNKTHDADNEWKWIEGPVYRHRRWLLPAVDEPGEEDEENEDNETRVSEIELKASMHLLQMQDDSETLFEIHNNKSAEVLIKGNLVKIIRDAHRGKAVGENVEPLDFNKTLEFNIELTFRTEMGIRVVVNGWEYIWIPGDLGWQ